MTLTPGFWPKKLTTEKVHKDSALMIADLVRQSKMKPSPTINFKSWTMPFYAVNGNSMPKVPVVVRDSGNNQKSIKALFLKGLPIPKNAKPGFNNLVDKKMQILDLDTNTYYELQGAVLTNGKWTCNNGAIVPNWSKSNGQMPSYPGSNYNSCTATYLPITPGLIRLDELKTGVPTHALCMAIAQPSNKYVFPAKRSDGMTGKIIPEGTRFRLPVGFKIDPSLPPMVKFVLKAIRDYGIYVIDKCPGGSITIYCEDPKELTIGAYKPYTNGLYGYQLGSMLKFDKWQVVA